jgi:hypothetical protein
MAGSLTITLEVGPALEAVLTSLVNRLGNVTIAEAASSSGDNSDDERAEPGTGPAPAAQRPVRGPNPYAVRFPHGHQCRARNAANNRCGVFQTRLVHAGGLCHHHQGKQREFPPKWD